MPSAGWKRPTHPSVPPASAVCAAAVTGRSLEAVTPATQTRASGPMASARTSSSAEPPRKVNSPVWVPPVRSSRARKPSMPPAALRAGSTPGHSLEVLLPPSQ